MHVVATRRMVLHVAITRVEVDDTIARRIGAPRPSLWVLASSVRPSRGLDF
jgi:hypothetical protein